MIHALKFCTVDLHEHGVTTRFPDGTECSNWPLWNSPEYLDIVKQCGFTDPLRYCHEHELLHSMLPEMLFNERGYVVWMAAHQRTMNVAAAKAEERLIWYVQRALRDSDHPSFILQLPIDLLPVGWECQRLGTRA